jgi:cytochrome c553
LNRTSYKIMHNDSLSLLIVLALAVPQVSVAGDAFAGKEKSQVCAACHAADGNSVNPDWPKLAGQHEEYLIKQLLDFRSGYRKNAQMSPMTTGLSDEDIHDLAAYYASQKIKHGQTDPAVLELGQKIYRAGNLEAGVPACSACHGPTGRGNPAAKYPALSGQHAAYITTQLNAFRSDARTNDLNEVMRTIVDRMTDEEIKAVAQFAQGLHFRE